ncbi:hypothetical protein [Roseateles koreensis]|uniref:Oxalate:formate antiporter n=1 Tax=Roseateles koreensis TaxID=2987526 RepID=A0ABT5KU93_9BURK|nr:hypothetical protein [Roseateles koreensis]MDC8786499.1 hypothetical protein [Roseateles koreensis]
MKISLSRPRESAVTSLKAVGLLAATWGLLYPALLWSLSWVVPT